MTDTVKTPSQHANDAAEAIRALNHATLRSGGEEGWQYPSDAYDVIGGLDRAAGMLPQALDQVMALVARLAASGHVRSDRGDTDRDLAEVRVALEDARLCATQLADALSKAHSATSPLAYQE